MRSYAMMIVMLWTEVFAVSFLLAGIILGTIGTSNYIRNRNDERTYRPWKTLCIVRNYTSKQCDYHGLSDCHDRHPCFNEEYLVDYEIFNKTIIRSLIKTKNKKNLNRKKNDTCYYDGRHNLTSVKWNYADKTLGFTLLCIGYGIVAVILPIIVIILICLIIERHRHHQQMSVDEEVEDSSVILQCFNEPML